MIVVRFRMKRNKIQYSVCDQAFADLSHLKSSPMDFIRYWTKRWYCHFAIWMPRYHLHWRKLWWEICCTWSIFKVSGQYLYSLIYWIARPLRFWQRHIPFSGNVTIPSFQSNCECRILMTRMTYWKFRPYKVFEVYLENFRLFSVTLYMGHPWTHLKNTSAIIALAKYYAEGRWL